MSDQEPLQEQQQDDAAVLAEMRAEDLVLPPEKFPIGQGLEKIQAKLKGRADAAILRRFNSGEAICRQGDAGYSAFYIPTAKELQALLDDKSVSGNKPPASFMSALADYAGAADQLTDVLTQLPGTLASLSTQEKRSRLDSANGDRALLEQAIKLEEQSSIATVSLAFRASDDDQRTGLFASLRSAVFGSKPIKKKHKPTHIPIDGPVDLRYQDPIDQMFPGEVFGELSCMSSTPRSATVTANREWYIIEFLKPVLEFLYKDKEFTARAEAVYRRRLLTNHLRALPLLTGLSDETIEKVQGRVDLVTHEPGEVVFKEGDESDCLYIIRNGTLKVTQSLPGGEQVLGYCSRGDHVGEIGMALGQPRTATCSVYQHPEGKKKRRAAPFAMRAQLVRIDKALFDELYNTDRTFRQRVDATRDRRIEADKARARESARTLPATSDDLGLLQGQKLMLIDLERCTRCDDCVRACEATHVDGVARLFREGPRFDRYLVVDTCRQCLDPVCMIGCPVGSIHKADLGNMVIEDWCIGCEICAKQCPYEAITMQDKPFGPERDKPLAVVCDQCNSNGGIASCVYACPHDAALRVNGQEWTRKMLG